MLVNNCVMHVLNKDVSTVTLSDNVGVITKDLDMYIQKLVKRLKKDSSLRKAKFNNYNENIVKVSSEAIIYGEDFLKNAKGITNHLFEIMSCSSDIESGVFLLATVTEKDDTFLAMLKLDYKLVNVPNISFEEDNKIDVQINTTHSISDRVKQGAIIGLNGVNDEYHLMVLDKDSEKDNTNSSFISSFLDVEKVVDDTYRTKLFMDKTDAWIINSISDNIKKAEDIRSLLVYKLKEKEELDIDEFIKTLDLDDSIIDDLKVSLDSCNLEGTFKINKKVVDKKLKKRTVKMSNGFKINGDLRDFEDPMKYSIRKNENGSTDIVIKNVTFIEG